jgi:hypothetical protein
MNDKEQILPHIMVVDDVHFEPFSIPIELIPLNVTNKAFVAHVFFHWVLLVSQLRERVNDNTKDNVKQHNDHNQEESYVKHNSHVVFGLSVKGLRRERVSDTSSHSKTVVEGGTETMEHGLTSRFASSVHDVFVDFIIVVLFEEEGEAKHRKDVDNDDA